MSDDLGDNSEGWENSRDGRRSRLPPEIKELIKNAGWKVSEADPKKAYVFRTGPAEWGPLKDALSAADIPCNMDVRGGTYTPRSLKVSVKDLDDVVPGWRKISVAKELAQACKYLKQDALKRAAAGNPWQEGLNPKQAIVFCKDADDAEILVGELSDANITGHRQGEGGHVVVASADALREVGIKVKKAVSEVAGEVDEQEKADARDWLKNRVAWDVPSEGSPLARAIFRNQGAVEVAIANLFEAGCADGGKRLPDKNGLTLVVNADALKAVVPDVNIVPFNHGRSTGDRDGEVQTGR